MKIIKVCFFILLMNFTLEAQNMLVSRTGTSPASQNNGINTLQDIVPAIANAATDVTASSFTLNWETFPGAIDYYVRLGTSSGGVESGQGYMGGNVISWTKDFNISPNTIYYFTVKAVGAIDFISDWSNEITVLTLPAAPTESAATNLAETSFTANWAAPLGGATGYKLDVSTDNSFGSFVVGFQDLDVGNVTNYSVTGLSGATTYYYRVRAYNASGTSSSSNAISALTIPAAPVATAALSITQTSFNINWLASTGATNYLLSIGSTPGGSQYISDFNAGNNINVNIGGATANTTYYYRVKAVNASGTSSASNEITVTTLINIQNAPIASAATSLATTSFIANWASGGAPTSIENTGFKEGQSGVSLSLSNVQGLNIVALASIGGYKLDVSTSNSFGSFVPGFENLNVGNVSTYSITGLSGGTTYYYRVREYNSGGTSTSSNTITALTIPLAPTATAATNITSSGFATNWDASSGATSYLLKIGTTSGGTEITAGVNVGNVLTASLGPLAANTTYYYSVKAVNESGISAASNEISAILLPDNNAPVLAATEGTALAYTENDAAIAITSAMTVSDVDDTNIESATVQITGNYQNGQDVLSFTNQNGISGSWIVGTGTMSLNGSSSKANYRTALRNVKYSNTSNNPNTSVRTVSFTVNDGDANSNTVTRNINVTAVILAPVASNATLITTTSFRANWAAVSDANSYILRVGTSPGSTNLLNDLNVGNVLTYHVIGLTSGMTYFYTVKAVNGGGTSAASNEINQLTLPAPPSAAPATSITQTSYNANWSFSAGATSYRIDIATDIGFSNFVSGYNNLDVGNVATFLVNANLTANTIYFYRVRANNSAGTSTNSNTVTLTTLPNAPSTPVAIAAISYTQTSFGAKWNAIAGASGYRIDVATNNDFTNFVSGYNDLDVGNTDILTVYHNITANTTYYYRVRAYNSVGTSTNSNTISFTTAPSAPIAISATTITQTSFIANWNVSIGATNYYLDVATDIDFMNMVPGYNKMFINVNTVGNGLTLTVNTNLNSNTTYYYRVRAYRDLTTSTNSNTITLTTLQNPPAAPVATSATSITKVSFIANWSAPFVQGNIEGLGKMKSGIKVVGGVMTVNNTTSDFTYRLDVSPDSTFANLQTGFNDLDVSTATSYLVTGLYPETVYYYRVRAYYGNSLVGANSNVTKVTTLTGRPSIPVANNASSVTSTFFFANWAASSDDAIGYVLRVSTNPEFTTFVSEEYINKYVGNVLTFLVGPLNPNTQYYYRVSAYSTYGASQFSNTITVATVMTSPNVPVATQASLLSTTGFNLNWNVALNATEYFIDVATDNSFASILSAYNNLSVGNVLTKTVSGLTPNTFYYYRIRGSNTGGVTANSNAIGQKTWGLTPNPPSNIIVTYDSNGDPILTWTDNSSDGNGFDIYRNSGTNSSKVGQVSTFVKIGSVVAGIIRFVDASASEGVSYNYSIIATRSDGASSDLSSPSANTPVVTAAPIAPSNLAGVVTSGKIVLTWNDLSLISQRDRIERSANTNSAYVQIGDQTSDINKFSDLNVQNGITYYYRVKTYQENNFSIYSNEIMVNAVVVTDVNDDSNGIPVAYRLFQNYPNPFNPSTMIRYAVPFDGKVKLIVFNIIGQEVKTLLDNNQSAGYHEVQFDATNFPSGIYIYKIEASNFVSIRKMILMK